MSKTIIIEDIPFLFDEEGILLLSQHKWYVLPDKTNSYYYLTTSIKQKTFRFHRLLMGNPNGLCVDHINGDTRDNRKCNLRICTLSQNSINKKCQTNNKSGIPGVRWKNEAKAWEAYIYLGHTNKKFLGYFSQKEDAVAKRLEAERLYFGEYAFNKRKEKGEQ